MQDEFNTNSELKNTIEELAPGTLYSIAMEEMRDYIEVYLELTRQTNGLTNIKAENVQSLEQRIVVLGGIESLLNPFQTNADAVVQEWQRMRVCIPLRQRQNVFCC